MKKYTNDIKAYIKRDGKQKSDVKRNFEVKSTKCPDSDVESTRKIEVVDINGYSKMFVAKCK